MSRYVLVLVAMMLGLLSLPAQAIGLEADGLGVAGQLVDWFVAPAQWHGPTSLPTRIVEHLYYMTSAMAVALLIALPVGIGLGHWGRGGLLAINVANMGRAVPSFGLVILMFLLVGFGFVPVLVALVALAIPPMVTNSYVGMQAVDPAVRTAAIALGLSRWQRLFQVELPIAMPLVMAGIRTSAVQVLSTATLAAYVGLGGLGRYLIDGLAQQQLAQVVGGALVVAVLAVLLEALLAGLQHLLVSPGLRREG